MIDKMADGDRLDRLLDAWAAQVRPSAWEAATMRRAIIERDEVELDARWWRTVLGCGVEPLRHAMDMRRFLLTA